VWRHPSVSFNNEKKCCEISEDKIAFCEKTAGLRRGKFSDSNSACLKVLVPLKIFQFEDMLNESERYQATATGLYLKKYKKNFNVFRSKALRLELLGYSNSRRRTMGASPEMSNFSLYFLTICIPINERLIKNKLTLFHRQGLTLANTLFPDSALGTQLPNFHHHLFYIKKNVDE
jgi:hypothetical protein